MESLKDLRTMVVPLTREIAIEYAVPEKMPDEINVLCEYSVDGVTWLPAKAHTLISESSILQFPISEWNTAMTKGLFTEYYAAGLVRTVVWNPYPEAQRNGRVSADFRVTLFPKEAYPTEGASATVKVEADNTDVVYIDDWSGVLQTDAISTDPAESKAKWWWNAEQKGDFSPSFGHSLMAKEKNIELPQLTYPLTLRGWYAIYVCIQPLTGGIEIRLSGDEATERFTPIKYGYEVFWRHANMTRQSLVVRQPAYTVYRYHEKDKSRAHIDYIKLVPLSDNQVRQLDESLTSTREKLFICYDEPYSWAFSQKVESNLQHREALRHYADYNVDIVDSQVNRVGAKTVFESLVGEQLTGETYGDPWMGGRPRTGNVGRMQQYTHTLTSRIHYSKELDMKLYANIGINNPYHGTPLEGEISREHPEWRKGPGWGRMSYEVPEVRSYALSLFEEVMRIGAEGISLEFLRYPWGFPSRESINDFLRDVRRLAQKVGREQRREISILVRFPAKGVNFPVDAVDTWKLFDYETWIKEGLVDILCPGYIWTWPMNFDITEYVAALKGTECKLCPCIEGGWNFKPIEYLTRAAKLYQDGADGVYLYGGPSRQVALLGSPTAISKRLRREKEAQTRYSKRIYLYADGREGNRLGWWEPLSVRVEGFEPSLVELFVDDELTHRWQRPPYYPDRPHGLPEGEHKITVRALDGTRWIKRTLKTFVGDPRVKG